MTKQQFIDWALSRGWTKDKFGHLHKSIGTKDYRFKLSSTHVRYELKVHFSGTYSAGKNEWMRLRSAYFKDLHITPEGKLAGMS